MNNKKTQEDFDFGTLNKNQRSAVETMDGPVRIIAGPGTGKTKTLVKRVEYLLYKRVDPSQIMVTTFTDKAATEIMTRVAIALEKAGHPGYTASRMLIGTFHSICLKLLKKYQSETRLRSGFTSLATDADQKMFIKHFCRCTDVNGKLSEIPSTELWIYNTRLNKLREDMWTLEKLKAIKDKGHEGVKH